MTQPSRISFVAALAIVAGAAGIMVFADAPQARSSLPGVAAQSVDASQEGVKVAQRHCHRNAVSHGYPTHRHLWSSCTAKAIDFLDEPVRQH